MIKKQGQYIEHNIISIIDGHRKKHGLIEYIVICKIVSKTKNQTQCRWIYGEKVVNK